MATQRFPLLSEEFTYISDAKKIPHSGLWNKVLDIMNSLFSMILVLSYQNKYGLRRVTEICKNHFVAVDLYSQTCMLTKQNFKFSISYSKLYLPLLSLPL